MSKARIKYWVLKDRKIYFRAWTGIGPCGTEKLKEAARFKTRHESMQSPAFSFGLTGYEPHAVRR